MRPGRLDGVRNFVPTHGERRPLFGSSVGEGERLRIRVLDGQLAFRGLGILVADEDALLDVAFAALVEGDVPVGVPSTACRTKLVPSDRYAIRTRNLQDWNLTRYRCANRSKAERARRRRGTRSP